MILYAKSWNVCDDSGEFIGSLYYDTDTKNITASIYKSDLNTQELKKLAETAQELEERTKQITKTIRN